MAIFNAFPNEQKKQACEEKFVHIRIEISEF